MVHREVSDYSLFGGFFAFSLQKERNIYCKSLEWERELERERRKERERRVREEETTVKNNGVCGAHVFTNTHVAHSLATKRNRKGMRKE